MEHIILTVYILLGSSGIAGLSSLVFLSVRLSHNSSTGSQVIHKNDRENHPIQNKGLVNRFLALHLLLFVGLAMTIAWFYSHNIIDFSEHNLRKDIIGILGGLSMTGLYIAGFILLRYMKSQQNTARVFRKTGMVISLTTALVVLASTVFHLSGLFMTLPFSPDLLAMLGYPLTTTSVLVMGIFCLFYEYTDLHDSVRFLGRATGFAAISYLPLTFAEMLLDSAGLQPYHPLSLDFIFYLELNAAAFIALYRSLSDRTPMTPLLGTLTEQTALGYALTTREKEMVSLIAKGLANKEIGAELGISPATVRTHIYNLFGKVGARSRIELLNILTKEIPR